MTATATRKPVRKKISLREDLTFNPNPLRVDRDKGIIYRVKMLGWNSANRRRYLPEAAKKALRLYEGSKAYANHPSQPNESRTADDALGVWRNVVCEDEGVFGDLHYFKSHPLCERICEDAERGMGVFGASHNADGQGDYQDGIFIVKEITEVRSVDIVTDPATVSSLQESSNVKTKKFKDVIKALEAKLSTETKTLLTPIVEDMGDMDVGDEGGSDHKADLLSALGKLVDSPDEEDQKLATKIMNLLKPAKPAATEEGDDDVVPPEKKEKETEEACDPDMPDKSKKESRKRKPSTDPAVLQLQEQLAKLTADKEAAELREWIREEATKRDLTPDKELLESLEAMHERPKIGKHLDYLKKLGLAKKEQPAKGPRSQGPTGTRPVSEGYDGSKITSGDQFLGALRA